MQQPLGAILGLSSGESKNELRQHGILQRRELRQKMMELVDETDLSAALARAVTVIELDAIDTVDHHGAGVGALK